jgi:transcriptional regulator with XRE-family HTH domain
MTVSPYVRGQRLRRELVALRERFNLTHDALVKRSGVPKSTLSRLENLKRRPNPNDVMKILNAVPELSEGEWMAIYNAAEDAAFTGWWEMEDIDNRQALYANLEYGATTIREYAQTSIPGLLQLPKFTQALTEYDDLTLASSTPASPEGVIRARTGRQRMARRPGGPVYEAILDEFAFARPIAPPAILAEQLRFLADLGHERFTIRVLPLDATVESYSTPRGGFNLYTYPDEGDPTVVAVDTVTSDLVLAEPGEADPYERLYGRLRTAALPEQDSARRLAEAADRLEG